MLFDVCLFSVWRRSKDQRSRCPGRFTHRCVNASGNCSDDRGHVLNVGTYCYVAVCRRGRLGGARRFGDHRGRRWAGNIVAAARLHLVWVEISAWNDFIGSPFTYTYQTICKNRDSFINWFYGKLSHIFYSATLSTETILGFGWSFQNSFVPQTYLHSIRIWRVISWSLFLFKHVLTVLVQKHVQCAHSPVHLVKSVAPSGSSWLSMNFYSRNY